MEIIYKDGTYLRNNPSWHEEDSPWKAAQIRRIIERNSLDPKRICEIGCGAGEILNQLSQYYSDKEFFGYEISPDAFELCSKKSKANLNYRYFDLLNDETAYFDLVLAIDVIEHVEDYFGFLRKLKEKAEYKIFHIPLDLSVQTILRRSKMLKTRRLTGHIHYFTQEIALEILKDTGYEIIDYLYTCGAIELPKGWRAKLMKIPRKLAFSANSDLTVRVLGGFSLLVLSR